MDDDVLGAFARSIFVKVTLLRANEMSRRDYARVLEAIGQDIRAYSDLIVPAASDAALSLASAMGIDILSMRWRDQNKFDPGRDLFLLEHVVPVKIIRDECLAADSEREVATALIAARVAWICRGEDDELTRLGYRSMRPDPAAAYRAAGIALAGLTYEAMVKPTSGTQIADVP